MSEGKEIELRSEEVQEDCTVGDYGFIYRCPGASGG